MTLLFKYRPPIDFPKTVRCNTARIFSNSALYYAKPSTFNDPFDGRILFDFIADKNDAYDRQFRVMRRDASPIFRLLFSPVRARAVSPANADGAALTLPDGSASISLPSSRPMGVHGQHLSTPGVPELA